MDYVWTPILGVALAILLVWLSHRHPTNPIARFLMNEPDNKEEM